MVYSLQTIYFICLFVLFVTVRSPKPCIPSHVFGIVGKSLARRGAQALFCGVPTYGGKIMDFQSFYEL